MAKIDPRDTDDLARKESIQQRHYFLYNELQNLARELPPKYQQRLPYELLSALSSSLLDGTVYEIVTGLKEIQHMTEKNLLSQRIKFINVQKAEIQEFNRKHKDIVHECQAKLQNLSTLHAIEREKESMQYRHAEDLTRADMKLILEMDQKVSDQQVTLEKAGVPGFFVTNNPNEIRIQMYLLEFVQRLREIENIWFFFANNFIIKFNNFHSPAFYMFGIAFI